MALQYIHAKGISHLEISHTHIMMHDLSHTKKSN